MLFRSLVALTRGAPADPLEELTGREREILTRVGQGLTNREIGERLHLSEKTIKHYITNILQKLQVRSRVEAALLAARLPQRPTPTHEAGATGRTDRLPGQSPKTL